MAARLAGKVPSATSHHRLLQAPHPHHYLTTWSMTKDSSLESALSRNRRWIVNNQIKQILLRSPGRVSTVRDLQKRFQTLDLQGRALNWFNKYPCCFTVSTESSSGDLLFGFSKRMSALIEEEESVMAAQEPAMARRFAKLLMLSRDHCLNVVKLNELKRSFGFPNDYLLRILPKRPNTFQIRNPIGRRNSMEIQLLRWQPELVVSAVEAVAMERGTEARFECVLPLSWINTREKFQEFNDRTPYVSPYAGDRLDMKSEEKRAG